jgi:hypothetical protein
MLHLLRQLCLCLAMVASGLLTSPCQAARVVRSRFTVVLAQALAPRHPAVAQRLPAPRGHGGVVPHRRSGQGNGAFQKGTARETAGPPPRVQNDIPALPVARFRWDPHDRTPIDPSLLAVHPRPTPGLDPEQEGRRGPPRA